MYNQLHCYILLSLIISYVQVHGGLSSVGPVGKIELFSFDDCGIEGTSDVHIEAELKNGKGEEKGFYATINMPFDLDATWKFYLKVHKWVDGTWKKDAYKADGLLCEYIEKYLPKLWKKISQAIQPPFQEDCFVPAGEYKLNNFQAEPSDISIPAILYGHYKLELLVVKDSNQLFCETLECETSRA